MHEKGQNGGQGACRGAHWHTIDELCSVFDTLPVQHVKYHSAVFLPSGSEEAQQAETLLSNDLNWGSFWLCQEPCKTKNSSASNALKTTVLKNPSNF